MPVFRGRRKSDSPYVHHVADGNEFCRRRQFSARVTLLTELLWVMPIGTLTEQYINAAAAGSAELFAHTDIESSLDLLTSAYCL